MTAIHVIRAALLSGVVAASIATACGPSALSHQTGIATFNGATVIERLSPTRMRIDLGPQKGTAPGGIIEARTTSTTRFDPGGFNLGGSSGQSLDELGVVVGMKLDVDIVTPQDSDGSYALARMKLESR